MYLLDAIARLVGLGLILIGVALYRLLDCLPIAKMTMLVTALVAAAFDRVCSCTRRALSSVWSD